MAVASVSTPTPSDQASAPPVLAFPSETVALSVGHSHACGLKSDGSVECWGESWLGQSIPPGGTFAALSAGDEHTCGLRHDGSAVCWGDDLSGQSSAPPGSFTAISAGTSHTCGLRSDGSAECWGVELAISSFPAIEPDPPEGTFAAISARVG